ncbi:MAG TPA: SHOCT domain-containing protein [Acidimicrobiales bacterium]
MELLDLFWSMLWFFVFIMWIYLFIVLIGDIFRSPDLSGAGKALWCLLLIVFPLLGALAYIIVRGHGISERQIARAQQQEQAFRSYVQDVAVAAPTPADEVAKLVALRDQGVISAEEFERQKARALA